MTLTPFIRYLLVSGIILVSACTKETVVHETMANGNTADPQSLSNALISDPGESEDSNPAYPDMETTNIVEQSTTVSEESQPTQPQITDSTDSQTTSQNPSVANPDSALSDPETDNGATTTDTAESELTNTATDNENPASSTTQAEPTSGTSDPSTPTDTAADPTEVTEPILPGSEESLTTGAPGEAVNCAQSLPCRWISADGQFEVTVTSTDNIGPQGRLTIEYSIQTSHDTELYIASTESAVDSTDASFKPTALSLGEGNGRVLLSVTAGTTTEAHIEFDSSSDADSLSSWTIGLSDAGLVRQPVFTDIPIGDATDLQADCAGLLPCVWNSPDGNATVSLISVNNSGSTNLLTVNFKVETLQDTTVAINSGTFAVDIEGMNYKGRTHGLGQETGAEELTANSFSGASIVGNIYFFRTQSVSSMLQLLSLVVYEDRPIPRWNPEFLSVPVQ